MKQLGIQCQIPVKVRVEGFGAKHFLLLITFVVTKYESSVKDCLATKVVFCWRSFSIKIKEHQRLSIIKGSLESKIVFHQKLSSNKGFLYSELVESMCLIKEM